MMGLVVLFALGMAWVFTDRRHVTPCGPYDGEGVRPSFSRHPVALKRIDEPCLLNVTIRATYETGDVVDVVVTAHDFMEASSCFDAHDPGSGLAIPLPLAIALIHIGDGLLRDHQEMPC